MTKKLSFGILLPTRGVILAKTAVPDLSPVFNLADAVEKAGYDSVWIGDSVTAKSRLEVISTLGALAVKTERVKIGTAVLLAAMRNPVVLAQALASVDVLCRGRLIVGVGVSRNDKMFEEEYTACGVPFNQKGGTLEPGAQDHEAPVGRGRRHPRQQVLHHREPLAAAQAGAAARRPCLGVEQ